MARTVPAPLPAGFRYLPDFLSAEEERVLVKRIARLAFETVEMRGMVAKRRVLHYGWQYGYESWALSPGLTIPDWLLPLRERVAALLGVPAVKIEEALVSRY